MDTYSAILRRWRTAGDLRAALAKHGCQASEILIRRWWNDEMLPARAMVPLVAACKDAGYTDITLERLLKIATIDRAVRLPHAQAQRVGVTPNVQAQPAA